jgi:hypothetical protein
VNACQPQLAPFGAAPVAFTKPLFGFVMAALSALLASVLLASVLLDSALLATLLSALLASALLAGSALLFVVVHYQTLAWCRKRMTARPDTGKSPATRSLNETRSHFPRASLESAISS